MASTYLYQLMATSNSPRKQPSLRPNRRTFIGQALVASAGATLSLSPGTARAHPAEGDRTPVAPGSKGTLPIGKIGNLKLSRLISGGNLISGWAHSRDLQYVPSLMRAYNTEEKVLDTLQLMEEHGITAIIADPIKKPKDILARYWKERGGKIQWIAEGHPDMDDWKTNIQQSIEFGASAVYVQGVKSDKFYKAERLDLLGKCVEFIKSKGVPGGIGAHKLEVIMESEKSNYGADFYVKTLHHSGYWSARKPEQKEDVVDCRTDNYWDLIHSEPSPSCRRCRNHGSPSKCSPREPSGPSQDSNTRWKTARTFCAWACLISRWPRTHRS